MPLLVLIGREVAQRRVPTAAGTNAVTVETGALAAGVYVVCAEATAGDPSPRRTA